MYSEGPVHDGSDLLPMMSLSRVEMTSWLFGIHIGIFVCGWLTSISLSGSGFAASSPMIGADSVFLGSVSVDR